MKMPCSYPLPTEMTFRGPVGSLCDLWNLVPADVSSAEPRQLLSYFLSSAHSSTHYFSRGIFNSLEHGAKLSAYLLFSHIVSLL